MEGEPMAVVTPDTFPIEILDRFRGRIIEARPAYPEVLHFTVRDESDGEWWFATQEAKWSPSDPGFLAGKVVVAVSLDDRSGRLTVEFRDGTVFTVDPDHEGAHDDLEAWQLFTPERTVLTYGPRGRWLLGRSDNRV
jgi:hypothetical protein